MTAELTRGQNHPLSQVRLVIRVSAAAPVVAGVTLGDDQGRVPGPEWVAHPGAPALPGLEVPRQAAREHRIAVDLDAVPQRAHRVHVLLALPGGAGAVRFGASAAPFVAVAGADGTDLATFTLAGLDAESAVVAVELYRRQGAWKVRAVGQGYAGGLAELLTDQGLPQAHQVASTIQQATAPTPAPPVPAPLTQDQNATPYDARPTAPTGPYGSPYDEPPAAPPQGAGLYGAQDGGVDYTHPRRRTTPPPPPPTAPPASPGQPAWPVAGDATGWSMEERLYNQVWGMFEDYARTTAAYRSAVDFADARMERELDEALADPRARMGGQADAAREAARAKHTQLMDQAREVLDRDLTQLVAESEVVEPALPPSYAGWDNPVWHAYRVPEELPMALRLGDLRLPESEQLRIPMLVRLPLERGLWIDSGAVGAADGAVVDAYDVRRLALDMAVAHVARLLAAHPAGAFTVHVVDAAGAAASSLAPLAGAGVLAGPPAVGAAGVADVLGRLTRRVDLVQMAVRGGAPDALPPDFDPAHQLLVVNDFPHGFDDRAVTQLRYLADEGPGVGVHLMMVADREDATAYGPLLDPLWRSLLRLTPVADDYLADPWVGHAWTYEPALVPPGSGVLQQVLAQVAAARTKP
ncbi:TerD family protein [Streptomyces acidiscabies]|uniref:Export associated protein n=1 Tax=Streptomyces acidiscabies TaxID=42234 RepID=A0A0L0KJM1_9ACTN|nr:TerD family protein [Streptomyces acidiscabies]KND38457.1 export associated protein [Streptomyces acidiscabies]